MKKNKNKYLVIILILLISIGFAYLSTELLIKGNSIVYGNKWEVIWDNTSVNVVNGSVTANTPIVDNDKTTVSYNITLNTPGDYYEFSLDAVNGGTIDAMISLITFSYKENNSTVTLPSVIKHTIKYADGSDVAVKDLLKENSRQKYYVNIEYDRNVTESNMVAADRTFNITIAIEYEQADNTANEIIIDNDTVCLSNRHLEITSTTVCKRAINLNSEKCIQEDTEKYCQKAGHTFNEKIVYGNCGTNNTLTAGDAFDCDVNGNGSYDDDERFYYVSPKDADENSDYATLIYYKNIDVDFYNVENHNYAVPNLIINKMPSKTTWKKVTLNNNGERQIKTNSNTTQVTYLETTEDLPLITYTNKAARLLTYQELVYSCGIALNVGQLRSCEFLLENTKYTDNNQYPTWWLETALDINLTNVWVVYADTSAIYYNYAYNRSGIRPAIEVPLKNIAY